VGSCNHPFEAEDRERHQTADEEVMRIRIWMPTDQMDTDTSRMD
jgi:hypothetical protein